MTEGGEAEKEVGWETERETEEETEGETSGGPCGQGWGKCLREGR